MSKESLSEEQDLGDMLGRTAVYPQVYPQNREPGISKRELFAAMAMQGLFSSEMFMNMTPAAHAKEAVLIADALLAELAK